MGPPHQLATTTAITAKPSPVIPSLLLAAAIAAPTPALAQAEQQQQQPMQWQRVITTWSLEVAGGPTERIVNAVCCCMPVTERDLRVAEVYG